MHVFSFPIIKGLIVTICVSVLLPGCTRSQNPSPDINASNSTASLVDQIDIPYQSFTLDNGLKVLVHSDHSIPTVFVGMWYKVGSADEPQGKTGFAHLFEHLMFQGSENREGEYFSPFTEAGATGMNGTTDPDRTNYYATVPTAALDMALWMESDRMSHLLGAIDQAALDEQRRVVKNEKRQGDNRPYAKVFPRISEAIYPVGHPYRHSTIGSMEDLSNASLEDVHEWFKKYYGAANAFLVLSGDVTPETARAKVEKYFGEAAPGEALASRKQWVPELAQNKIDVMYDTVPQTALNRVWLLPPSRSKDANLMQLVAESLVNNKNAPLYKKLVDDLKLATRVQASAYSGNISGVFTVNVLLKPDADVETVRRIVDDEIAEYLKNGPSRDILEASKLDLNMSTISQLESTSVRGFILASSELSAGDPEQYKTELKWLNNASESDLRTAANTYLSKNYYELTVLPFPEYKPGTNVPDRSSIPVVKNVDSDVTFPEAQTATLSNGAKLVFAKHGTLPLINIYFEFQTGSFAEMANETAAAPAAFALLDDGTTSYDANELSTIFDKIGMQPGISAGEVQSGISYQILTPYLEESLELVADMLENYAFPQAELDKQIENWKVALDGVKTDPSRQAGAYFDRAIYGVDNPKGHIWTKEIVSNLKRETLIAFFEREIVPENLIIYMIGNMELSDAVSTLEKAIGKWSGQGQSQLKVIGHARPNSSRVILVDKPGAVQSTIYAGQALPAYDRDTATTLGLVNSIFGGGFEARINMNLREDKGWSYGMRSRLNPNNSGDQSISVSGGVQTDKTMESMIEIRKEFQDFISSRPAMQSELDREVLSQSRSLPGRYSTSVAFLSSMARSASYGLPYDYAANAASRLNGTSLEDVDKMAKTVFEPDNLTWVVVGDLSKIEDGVRSLDYGPVEIWDPYGKKLK